MYTYKFIAHTVVTDGAGRYHYGAKMVPLGNIVGDGAIRRATPTVHCPSVINNSFFY